MKILFLLNDLVEWACNKSVGKNPVALFLFGNVLTLLELLTNKLTGSNSVLYAISFCRVFCPIVAPLLNV